MPTPQDYKSSFTSIEIDEAIAAVKDKENSSNKVTSLSSQSTDTEYPSAKCVYDIIGNIESLLAAI